MKFIGGIWLIIYGINKIKNSRNSFSDNFEYQRSTLGKVILTTLAITYANPHVYLDTVFFLGNFSATNL